MLTFAVLALLQVVAPRDSAPRDSNGYIDEEWARRRWPETEWSREWARRRWPYGLAENGEEGSVGWDGRKAFIPAGIWLNETDSKPGQLAVVAVYQGSWKPTPWPEYDSLYRTWKMGPTRESDSLDAAAGDPFPTRHLGRGDGEVTIFHYQVGICTGTLLEACREEKWVSQGWWWGAQREVWGPYSGAGIPLSIADEPLLCESWPGSPEYRCGKLVFPANQCWQRWEVAECPARNLLEDERQEEFLALRWEDAQVFVTTDVRGKAVRWRRITTDEVKRLPYFDVRDITPTTGCNGDQLSASRTEFKRLYDKREYTTAREKLTVLLSECRQVLSWSERGWITNDLAITQYKLGQLAECRLTLQWLAADASTSDDELRKEWATDFDARLPIIKATRFNLSLCKGGSPRP